MNKKLLSALIIVLGLITLTFVSAGDYPYWYNQGQNDTYVDLHTAIKLSAQGGNTETKWISQEVGNASACAGSWDSTYTCAKVNDSDWTTHGEGAGGVDAYFYVNYTKPAYVYSPSRWEVKDEGGRVNLTIPSACWNQNPLQFNVTSRGGALEAYWYCWDGTGWSQMRYDGTGPGVYEERVLWNTTPGNISYAILSTNETGVWENKTAYGSPMDLGQVWGIVWSNFTWQNTSLDCNKVIGWRIYYNDTDGDENVTDIKTFYHIPFVNDTSYALSKITSATCESKHNITLTFNDTPAGRVSVIMPFVYFDSTPECAYEGSEGTRITIYNESEYCWIRLNHSSLSSGDTIKIYSTKSLRVEPPPNLPAALTAAAVGLIIVIYFIVSKEEES